MKLLRVGAVVLAAVAAAATFGAAMQAPQTVETAAPIAGRDGAEPADPSGPGMASHDLRLPNGFLPASTPPDANWGSLFSRNWR